MAVFLIAANNGAEELGRRIASNIPANDFYAVSPTSWLVSVSGLTSRQLSESLGINTDNSGISAVVVSAASYWGRHTSDLWEWLSVKQAAHG